MRYMILVKVFGELLFVCGLLSWIYGVVIVLVHPSWLSAPLSHLTPWLRQDAFTILSFLISNTEFFMWRPARELTNWGSLGGSFWRFLGYSTECKRERGVLGIVYM